MNTPIQRLVALVAALAATVSMVASLLTFQAQRAHNAEQLPAQCLGYLVAQLQGQTVLVPANLCDPANRAVMQGQHGHQEQRRAPSTRSYSV